MSVFGILSVFAILSVFGILSVIGILSVFWILSVFGILSVIGILSVLGFCQYLRFCNCKKLVSVSNPSNHATGFKSFDKNLRFSVFGIDYTAPLHVHLRQDLRFYKPRSNDDFSIWDEK